MNNLIGAIALLAMASTSASALVIREDYGGNLYKRIQKIKSLKESGENVRIVGECMSSCTLILLLPRNQVCASKKAVLGFHAMMKAVASGSDKPKIVNGKPVLEPHENQMEFINMFPDNVKEWLVESEALKSSSMTRIPATKFIRLCEGAER